MSPTRMRCSSAQGRLNRSCTSARGALGLEDRVRMLGWRDDTVALMRVADLFVFPRAEEVSDDLGKEGLGLVVVEAQAAGLSALLSRGIPDDAIVIPELCETLSVSEGSKAWASQRAEHSGERHGRTRPRRWRLSRTRVSRSTPDSDTSSRSIEL